jgi:hypothetical protein
MAVSSHLLGLGGEANAIMWAARSFESSSTLYEIFRLTRKKKEELSVKILVKSNKEE